MSPEDAELIVRVVAAEYGVEGDFAVAIAIKESSLRVNASGDSGASVGLFQLHEAGLGYGMSYEQRTDPWLNSRVALAHLVDTAASRTDLAGNPGALAAASQRPYDPVDYAVAVNAILGELRRESAAAIVATPETAETAAPGEYPGWTETAVITSAGAQHGLAFGLLGVALVGVYLFGD